MKVAGGVRWRGYLVVLTLAGALAIVPTSSALAAWSAFGPGGAAGAGAVMPGGTVPAVSAASSAVTVSWIAATLPNGAGVAGYVINRYNATTGVPATVGEGCSGIVSSTTCTEQSVQPGTWVYTETPVQLTWTGARSPDSAPIVVT